MLTVTVGAVRSIAHAGFQRFTVHAFVELPCDFAVTFGAGSRDIPMAHRRLRVARWANGVAPMAVRADSRVFTLEHSPSMHALQVLLDGVKHGNLVARQESGIGMTLGANRRLVFLCNFRSSFGRSRDFVHGAVAGGASGGIRVAGLCGLAVNAFV